MKTKGEMIGDIAKVLNRKVDGARDRWRNYL